MAAAVPLLDAVFRLGLRSQTDRDREEHGREELTRTARWPAWPARERKVGHLSGRCERTGGSVNAHAVVAPVRERDERPPTRPASDEPSRRRRLLILAICCSALLIVSLDATIVNIALPSISRDFHAQISGLQWIVDAYTLVLASLLMLSGSTADRIGRRRVFMFGLCVFSIGSLLCSLAPDLDWLIAFRALQAIGGSMLTPVALSIVRNVFADERERAQAIGLWGATVGVSMALGPILGGVLVVSLSWRAVFWINLPVGLVAVGLTRCFVPESRARTPRRLDPVGQFLVIALLASLTYAIISAPSAGWGSLETLATFAVSAISLIALSAYEVHRREPLLEMRFFRSIPFSGANATAVCAFAALGGFLFLNTLYLQDVRHLTALDAGLHLLPLAVTMLVCSPLSGRLVGAGHARSVLVAGGAGIAGGAAMLTGLRDTTSLTTLLIAYGLFGIGLGVVNAPISNTAVDGMPAAQAGVAAALASTSRQVGQTLGVAVLGATASAAVAGSAARGFVAATHVGWWIIVGCGALVCVLGMLTTTQRAAATAQRAGEGQGERSSRAGNTPGSRRSDSTAAECDVGMAPCRGSRPGDDERSPAT